MNHFGRVCLVGVLLAIACASPPAGTVPKASSAGNSRSTATQTSPAAPTSSPATACGRGLAGDLRVCPGTAAVGTTVAIEGNGCAAPGTTVVKLSFERVDGSAGASLADVQADASGRFRTSFVIPAQLGAIQGIGGGPTVPGTYRFLSHPPGCTTEITVS